MAIRDEEPTCEELADKERCDNEECFDIFCGQPNINQLLDEVFGGNDTSRMRELARLVYTTKLCPSLQTNGEEKVCGCSADEDNACCAEEVYTGCDDPDKCPNRTWGFDLVAIIKAAQHASSLAYVPISGIKQPDLCDPFWDIPEGTVLTWDPNAQADNKIWDDCKPSSRGAFVPTDLKALIQECIAEGA